MTALLTDRSTGPSVDRDVRVELELLGRVELRLLLLAERQGGGREQAPDGERGERPPGPPQAHRGVSLTARWRIAKSIERPARSHVKATRNTAAAVRPICSS